MSFTIFPAIDLRGGKVVRLKGGDPNRMTVYSNDPAETALRWLDAGATWVHGHQSPAETTRAESHPQQ